MFGMKEIKVVSQYIMQRSKLYKWKKYYIEKPIKINLMAIKMVLRYSKVSMKMRKKLFQNVDNFFDYMKALM